MKHLFSLNSSFQHTLAESIPFQGVGLHSGHPAKVVIRPAALNTGIVFVRADLAPAVEIPGTFEYVTETQLATTLGVGSVTISTVEHLLAGLRLMGIDNARIDVYGPEVPILDGSSADYCDAIARVGLVEQSGKKLFAVVKKQIEVRKGDKSAMISPSDQFHIHARVHWDHAAIGDQTAAFTLGLDDYRDVAPARTFGFLRDVERLQAAGLIRGGSLDNAVVLDRERVLNREGLRFSNEFARHKLLDAVGDFALAKLPMMGDVLLVKAGHELHAELVQAVFSSPDNYDIKTLDQIAPTQESSMAMEWFQAIKPSALMMF